MVRGKILCMFQCGRVRYKKLLVTVSIFYFPYGTWGKKSCIRHEITDDSSTVCLLFFMNETLIMQTHQLEEESEQFNQDYDGRSCFHEWTKGRGGNNMCSSLGYWESRTGHIFTNYFTRRPDTNTWDDGITWSAPPSIGTFVLVKATLSGRNQNKGTSWGWSQACCLKWVPCPLRSASVFFRSYLEDIRHRKFWESSPELKMLSFFCIWESKDVSANVHCKWEPLIPRVIM